MSKRGRPITKHNQYQPTQYWTGDPYCIQLMSLIGTQCTYQYRFATGIKAKYQKKDCIPQKEKISVDEYNNIRENILKTLKKNQLEKSIILRSYKSNDQRVKCDQEQEEIEFQLETKQPGLLRVVQMMNKVRILLDLNCLKCFQKILNVYAREKETKNMDIVSYQEDSVNRAIQECIALIKSDKKEFIEFHNLQIIQEYIRQQVIQNEDSKNNIKERKLKQKSDEMAKKIANYENYEDELDSFSTEVMKSSSVIHQLLQSIFEIWDSCATSVKSQ